MGKSETWLQSVWIGSKWDLCWQATKATVCLKDRLYGCLLGIGLIRQNENHDVNKIVLSLKSYSVSAMSWSQKENITPSTYEVSGMFLNFSYIVYSALINISFPTNIYVPIYFNRWVPFLPFRVLLQCKIPNLPESNFQAGKWTFWWLN